jgi:hypothetical protein
MSARCGLSSITSHVTPSIVSDPRSVEVASASVHDGIASNRSRS